MPRLSVPNNTPLSIVAAAVLMVALVLFVERASAQDIAADAEPWTPVIELFDGVPMARVPAGCFMMGGDESAPNEAPAHEVCFEASYWLDVYEVTHAQFAAFGGTAGRVAAFADIGGDLPRERVTWFEALDFCALRGARLPNEAEWEFAARGIESRLYPWGEPFVDGAAVVALAPDAHPQAVGQQALGVSWTGIYNLAGNVFEWTSSLFMPYPFDPADGRERKGHAELRRVIRGGAWSYNADLARSAARGLRPPTTESPDIGFRCARDL
ncbi:MAG: formylglycine-generating enzyme family protein [Chloroflexota bacterium]|nr:formylglycine-generating enzyme family protein [Chloroflexota bacterium]